MTAKSFRRSCLEGKRDGEGSLRKIGSGKDEFSRFLDLGGFLGVEEGMTGIRMGFLKSVWCRLGSHGGGQTGVSTAF